MALTVETVTKPASLGEGPHWDIPSQCLYYVDIHGQTVHKYIPSTESHTKVKIEGGTVGFVIPIEDRPDQLLISIGKKLAAITWDGVSETVSKMEILMEVEQEQEYNNNRFNDAKADPYGRLIAGTMSIAADGGRQFVEKGSLYSLIGPHQINTLLTNVGISNGLAWNQTLGKMYFIDSLKICVVEFDYDFDRCKISNKKIIFDLPEHNVPGFPDGMTIDSDGNLWVAIFDGGRIVKIDPATSKLLETIHFPARQITSAVFGGPNLDILYVTSAKMVVNEGDHHPEPAGAVFKVTNTGSKGLPCSNFKLF